VPHEQTQPGAAVSHEHFKHTAEGGCGPDLPPSARDESRTGEKNKHRKQAPAGVLPPRCRCHTSLVFLPAEAVLFQTYLENTL